MKETWSTEEAEGVRQEATKQETDRKCPDCGGVMDFDPGTGGLVCPYCGHGEKISGRGDGLLTAQELDFETAEKEAGCDWGAQKKIVICKSCGAESVYDELALASECPYCGSNQVMEEKGETTMAPGGVVPFAITAREAAGRFSSWIRRKLFCPGAAKESARPGAFKGVYLPYWTFDADTESDYEAEYGIDRRVRVKGETRTETVWYPASGTYREKIDDALVLGSSRYDDGLLRRVEPFRTSDNLAYRPEYVAGFIAERYSVGLKPAWEKAKQLIEGKLESGIQDRLMRERSADHVRIRRVRTKYSHITFKYLLLPVWLSTYRYEGKVYHFMVNGQSGKAGGEVPVSPVRIAVAVLLVADLFLLTGDFWLLGCALGALTAALAVICKVKKM